jgi:acetyltransferase
VSETICIRPIEPADAAGLRAFYGALSPDSRRLRFLSAATRLGDAQLEAFCGPDHEHREGLVAVAAEPQGTERIVAHLCLEPTAPGEVEIAIAVADEFQRHGVGVALVEEAARWARAHGTRTIRAWCAVDNVGIRRLLAHLHRPMSSDRAGAGSAEIAVDMTRSAPIGSAETRAAA